MSTVLSTQLCVAELWFPATHVLVCVCSDSFQSCEQVSGQGGVELQSTIFLHYNTCCNCLHFHISNLCISNLHIRNLCISNFFKNWMNKISGGKRHSQLLCHVLSSAATLLKKSYILSTKRHGGSPNHNAHQTEINHVLILHRMPTVILKQMEWWIKNSVFHPIWQLLSHFSL